MLYRNLTGVLAALLIIAGAGITGYMSFEGWSVLDAFYMTVITLSSVGFMEVHELSSAGRIFTAILIMCGTGVVVYGISVITAFIVEGELTDVLRRKKMDKKIEKLNNHYIVCGADQTGRYVIDELLKTNRDFIVIEKDPEKIQRFIDNDILCIQGDATHDAVLLAAGINKAKGFITSLNTDADNLMAVVTAKRLNADMRVISKAIEEESEQKIKLAGADSVVLPNFIGGLRMVSEVVRPSVVTFLDAMLRDKKDTIRIENITIKPGSAFAGKTLQETGLSSRAGISIVAIMDKQGGDYLINPSQDTIVHENNILIVMGKVEIINELRGAAR